MINKNKQQIKDALKIIIQHISDKDYQKRVWIRGEGPEVDDFDETVCNFSQEGDGVIEKYKKFGLTEHQYQQLKHFRDRFKKFSDENDFPEVFIDTPEWAEVMKMAKDVLRVLEEQKK